MNHSTKFKHDLENLTQKTFYFCLGATSSIVQNTQDNLQQLSKNAQQTVEELIKRGEDTYSHSPEINFPNFQTQESVNIGLKTRLFMLVKGDKDLAERLINLQKQKNPGHPEKWYWEKVIYDLERN
ncbi:hypothetical protein cce_4592 [Crocosphaera subtropica ATCC 51142]|uniref:Uncharacterized protein n=1 Tax=Crocosphaera subtropica (strain ATCC 51142 / BH68) TaxID=43989 RepID=B1WVF0_CROS5|nr:hypothetical protein [Crocosphaera subtropica]ACB53940.1 hypothetical protein cce_4592 [Crocosphaera subtropica ATCC 51142]